MLLNFILWYRFFSVMQRSEFLLTWRPCVIFSYTRVNAQTENNRLWSCNFPIYFFFVKRYDPNACCIFICEQEREEWDEWKQWWQWRGGWLWTATRRATNTKNIISFIVQLTCRVELEHTSKITRSCLGDIHGDRLNMSRSVVHWSFCSGRVTTPKTWNPWKCKRLVSRKNSHMQSTMQ